MSGTWIRRHFASSDSYARLSIGRDFYHFHYAMPLVDAEDVGLSCLWTRLVIQAGRGSLAEAEVSPRRCAVERRRWMVDTQHLLSSHLHVPCRICTRDGYRYACQATQPAHCPGDLDLHTAHVAPFSPHWGEEAVGTFRNQQPLNTQAARSVELRNYDFDLARMQTSCVAAWQAQRQHICLRCRRHATSRNSTAALTAVFH